MDSLISGSAIHPLTYTELVPLFVFNISKQSEHLIQGVVDILVVMQFSVNVASNMKAYALVIIDRRLKLQSDDKNTNMLYECMRTPR